MSLDMKAIAREVARIIDRGEVEFQHDDDAHRGSAKRDTANGTAGLDASGVLLVPGSRFSLTRDGSDNIVFAERTSGEAVFHFKRVAANDYGGYINAAAAWTEIQTAAMKNTAGGFPGLVAAPATASSAGTAGSIAYASGFIYICVATNTWERAVIATW